MFRYLPWSENIKKRACRYLLQRYLGNFLEEKLSLNQLSVDLYNGTGTVSDVSLDCEAINELGESQNWPLEIVDGYMQRISVSIPWSTILKDDSVVEVYGLSVTVQPKLRTENASSMLESMWSSMSSSMQLAAECLQQEADPTEAAPVEGIEIFAQTIDSILSRVKVKFIDTKIRVEHVPKDSETGIAFEIHIKNLNYLDEAGSEPPTELMQSEKNKTYVVSTFTSKKLSFEGVTFYTDEYPSRARTFSRSLIMEKSTDSQTPSDQTKSKDDVEKLTPDDGEVFYETRNTLETSSSSASPESAEPEQVAEKKERDGHDHLRSPDVQTEPILFGKLTGRQEMNLRIKNSEEAAGPKVDLQLTLGSLIVFLSPRQLHTLIELTNGLISPHLEDTSNMPRRTGAMPECKPMNAMDFERVEAQLLSGLTGGSLPTILTRHGWSSTGGMEDSDMDSDKFHPMASAGGGTGMGDSCLSSVSSMSASMTSSASTTFNNISPAHRVKRNRKVPQIDGDPTAEVSHINIRIASCACILLHQDILVPLALGPECLLPSSVHEMQATAVQFFEQLGLFAISGYGSKDYDHAHRVFDDACSLSHLRLLSTSITIEGNEKTTSQGCLTMGHFTVARLHLREYLCNNDNSKETSQAYDILNFLRQEKEEKNGDFAYSNPLGGLPDIKLTFKKTQKAMRVAGEKRLIYPTTDISVALQPCEVDLDLTILDRVSASTHPLPLCRPVHPARTPAPPSTGQLLDQTISVQLEHQCGYKVECERFLLRLRFPIIDFRTSPDSFNAPRLERNVRPDSLRATFTQLLLRKVPDARRATKIQLQSHQIDLYYFENDNDSGIHLGCATSDEISDSHNVLYGMESPEPTITITVLPTPRGRGPFDASSDEEGPYEAASQAPGAALAASALLLDELGSGAPGPFSSKKMAHESDTPHRKEDHGDMEELIVPGSAEEMEDFTQHSISHSAIQVECSLPVLSLQLESKQLYEVIYNRINTDLLLWEPVGRNIQSDMMKSVYKTNVLVEDVFKEANIYPAFSMCKSGVEYDSDSASSSSEDDNNVYYSTYDQKMKQKASQSLHMMKKESNRDLHNFCLSLRIGKGLLTMYTPVRDSSNHVVPNQAGESVVVAARLALCQVSGVHGRPRTALTSLHSRVARLYHCGLLPVPLTRPPLRMYRSTFSPDLYETIYPSGPGVSLKDGATGKDMLSVAISVNPNKDLNNFKNIRVAVGITGATLRHRWAAAGRGWLGQLLDTLDVLDYPVPGYQPSTVLTELHVHLWDSAIDYRPLYLPTKSVITLGSFSISSNVIANTNTSNLRFIAQECSLFLSELTSKSKPTVDKPAVSKEDNAPVDLQKNYVCVMDLGLFELSLRLTEKSVKSTPHVDLRASNNAVHIWTCADSASSLFRLLTYVACDGDGTAPGDESNTANSSCSVDTMGLSRDEMLIGVDDKSQEDIRELSPSEAQQVNDLMEEAMKESPNSSIADQDETHRSVIKEGVAVYYFPDESNSPKRKSEVDKPEATDSTDTIKETLDPVQDDEDLCPQQPDEELEERLQEVEDKTELLPAVIHVTRDLGDVHSPPKTEKKNVKNAERQQKLSEGSGNTDDEFCIIEERPVQTDPDLAEPVVRWLVKEPLNVIDNHFTIPTGKTDVLKAPKYFPMAMLRYTLCEMTVVWHMYGGNDFKSILSGKEEGAKKTVTISDNQCRYSPTLAKRSSDQDPYNVIPRSPPSLPHRGTPHWQSAAVSYRAGSETVRTSGKKTNARGGIGRTCGAAWKYRGGSGRVRNTHVEFELNKVRFQHETYPEGEKFASRQTLAVAKVEVRDRLKGSSINKFLSDYTEEGEPERKNSNMVVIKAVHVRPDPQLAAQECCLKVSVQPLRFRIDQDTMQFLVDFFTKLGDGESLPGEDSHSVLSGSNQSLSSAGGTPKHSTPTRQLPVMTVGSGVRADRNRRRASGSTASDTMTGSECGEEDAASLGEDAHIEPLMENYEAERLVSENLIQLEEDFRQVSMGAGLAAGREHGAEQRQRSASASSETVDDSPIYFRRVVFSPEVPIRLDYLGKRVDLKHGPLAGLIMGLGQLDCSQLKLKSLNHKHGILGFDRLLRWALHEWLTDIRRSQLPGILGGIGPMHSLLQFVRGVCDLVWLPIAQWRRDGRLVLGLRRGAASFTARTAVAALDITARLIHLIQATAETALDMVSPGPTLRPICARQRRRRARRRDPARQPHDIREGIANAYQLVKEGFSDTAQTMVVVAQAEHEARGYSGAVGGVLRQLPGVAVTPLALAAAATADILGGVRAQLVPGARRDDDDKWRAAPDQDDEADAAAGTSLDAYQP